MCNGISSSFSLCWLCKTLLCAFPLVTAVVETSLYFLPLNSTLSCDCHASAFKGCRTRQQ